MATAYSSQEPITPYQKWELFLKFVSACAVVASVFIAANSLKSQADQFNQRTQADHDAEVACREAEKKADLHLRQQEVDQREREYAARFYDHQMALYQELCDVTARIGVAQTVGEADKDMERFRVLYIGKATAFAGSPIWPAIKDFNAELLKLKSSKQRMPEDVMNAARDIAYACRESLRRAFPGQEGIQALPPTGKPVGSLSPDK